MPYPVLPPPPPPMVTSVVFSQAEYAAPARPQETLTVGQPEQASDPSSEAALGDRALSITSPIRTESDQTETSASAPMTAVLPPTSSDSSSPAAASLFPLSSRIEANAFPCLAPPELSAPESSALLAPRDTTLECAPTQSTTQSTTQNTTEHLPHVTLLNTGSNDSVGSVNQQSNAGTAGDIYYIIDTFTPDQLFLPSLQQLEQQRPGPAREITKFSLDAISLNVVSLDATSSSSPVNNIAQSSTAADEFPSSKNDTENPSEELEILQELNPIESHTPPIGPPSEPIPIFVPEPGQSIPSLPSLQDEVENITPLLNESGAATDELLLEDIPVLDPSSTLERDIPGLEPSPTLEGDIPVLDPSPTIELDPVPGGDRPIPGGAADDGATDDGAADDGAADDGGDINDDPILGGDTEGEAQPDDAGADSLPNDQIPNVAPQSQGDAATSDAVTSDALEVTADRQVYDQEQQSFLAEGNALMTFRGTLLQADRLRVNLRNRVVVAQGNAVLTRGDQVIRGERLEYDLIQDQGSASNARGEVYIPQTTSDFNPTEQSNILSTEPEIPLSEQLANEQPVTTATSTGELIIGGSLSSPTGGQTTQDGLTAGTISRIRFEADEIIFTPDGWEATNVRLTNDPFSPPELEIRSRLVTFRRLDENRSELRARRPRAVLDQGLHIPLFRERAIFDQRDRNPAPFNIGFDDDDRGGFFIERAVDIVATDDVEFTLTPQFFAQRAWENSDGTEEVPPDLDDSSSILDPDLYGLLGNLTVDIGSKTSLVGSMELTSFDFGDNIADEFLRGSVRLRRKIITELGPHELTTEYSYRDRLFNGTLGFQTIRRSYGVVLTSPTILLGDSGVQLTYQGGIQRVNADIATERLNDLLPPIRDNNRLTLTRYQAAARLQRLYLLWSDLPLPATPDQGLRYTSRPVVPFVAVIPSLQGVASFYSSGDTQPILTGSLSLLGQFGHFSRPYLDFFGFSLSYRHSTEGSESPFLFDRENDREVVSGGVTVQLLGPIRVGFQTSLSLSEDEEFDNTFILEYSRRTHGVVLRYSPDREQGSINLRISDFDWQGTPEPFGGNPDD